MADKLRQGVASGMDWFRQAVADAVGSVQQWSGPARDAAETAFGAAQAFNPNTALAYWGRALMPPLQGQAPVINETPSQAEVQRAQAEALQRQNDIARLREQREQRQADASIAFLQAALQKSPETRAFRAKGNEVEEVTKNGRKALILRNGTYSKMKQVNPFDREAASQQDQIIAFAKKMRELGLDLQGNGITGQSTSLEDAGRLMRITKDNADAIPPEGMTSADLLALVGLITQDPKVTTLGRTLQQSNPKKK